MWFDYYYNQMYTKQLVGLFIACLTGAHLWSQNVESQQVSASWELSRFGVEETHQAFVPGNVHLDLIHAGAIPDPFVGTNEDSVQWVGEQDWTYTSGPFSVDRKILDKEHVRLIFKGLDTYANVWLNDQHILSANNYHRSWEVDAKSLLKESGNILQVNFKSPVKIGEILASETDYVLPGEELRALTRKPQFHYGWDWGPKLIGCGIHGDIVIEGFDNLRLISHDVVVLDHVRNETPVRFVFQISAEEKWSGTYKLTLNDSTHFAGSAKFKPGENTLFHTYDSFPKSQLWWPRGKGAQTFNKVELKLASDNQTVLAFEDEIAVRRVDLVTNKDPLGESFFFAINDEAIFCKGANYIPIDFFQSRVSEEAYDRVIQDVIRANMNMLRVWGGGIYESEYFYDQCDKHGIMVWQDFMYACAMYPGQKYFLENATIEAEEQLKRLAHHPSIVLWCGNNENSEGWHRWGWQADLSRGERREVWKSYKKLFQKTLPKAVRDFSALPYWESSPMLGRGDPKHQYRGDAHYWGVWHDAQPFDTLNYVVPRFMSEFGFQSFPELRTIRHYTGSTRLSSDNPAIISHEKHPRGFALIEEYMTRDYGFVPQDFGDFVWLSQIQQAEGIGLGLDAHRRNAPYCMGTLYWQLNDCWPVASWSSVDYFGRWKPLHYEARKQFEPQKLSYFMRDSTLTFNLCSDLDIDPGIEANWTFSINTFDGAPVLNFSGTKTLRNQLSQLVWQYSIENMHTKRGELYGLFELEFGDRKLHVVVDFAQPAEQVLQQPNIEISQRNTEDGVELSLKTDTYTRNVWIEPVFPGRLSDNNFDLVPGQTKYVMFNRRLDVDGSARFSVRSLNDLMID